MGYEPEPITVGSVTIAPGQSIDVIDRAGRLLGHVTVDAVTGTVDVSDRAGRLLGHVTVDSVSGTVTVSVTGTVDVADRAARLLGVVTSITNPVDISDRAGRLLGIVASITAAVDVSDRAARQVGVVDTELPAAAALADNLANPTTPQIGADSLLWNPTNAQWERARTPVIWKVVNATAAGNTALWTPTAGKKFRLMGCIVNVSGGVGLAAAGEEVIELRDSATVVLRVAVRLPAAAGVVVGTDLIEQLDFPGNGYLSAAANNVLNVNLGTAVTAGNVVVNAWGTEE